jgi:predicted ATPase/DNA-binding SARP family transcriptional activator
MVKKLELTLFGNLEIHHAGVLVTDFKSIKSQALLCYLAVTAQPHTRSSLAGLLWGDMPETKARMNLSQALSTLRRLFNPHLEITRQTIALKRGSDLWVDVNTFEARVVGTSGEVEVPALQEAIQLYRGEFLDDFYVRKAPEFEGWVMNERARLRELAIKTLYALAVHHAGKEEANWEEAIGYTARLLTLEPWHEEAHRLMMRLLAISGQRSSALIQYQRCHQILADELGVAPGEETTTLYERIRDGEFEPQGGQIEIITEEKGIVIEQPLTGDTRLERSPIPTNIPPQPTNFVGREGELDALVELINYRENRLVTLVGPGGIGKTRLALEFAERQLQSITLFTENKGQPSSPFPNGIYLVSLEPLISIESILPAIAEAMRYRLDRGEIQLMGYLREKRLLLVMDNFEHLLDGADIISRILDSAPDVHILVTSRERLRLHQEQVVPLHGLEYPEPALVGSAAEYSSGKLFLQAAHRQRPDITLDDSENEYLARICRLVEGMPLALELAATWTNTLPLSHIATEIQRNFDFLAAEFRNIPPRHHSLRAVIDVSWEQLLPAEQTMFSQLSIFRGGFSRDAAAKISGARIQSLSTLVDKSLLRYSKTQDRYYIHELLRQYGADKLTEQYDEVGDLHNRHSLYYCQWFADQVGPGPLKTKGQKTVLDEMTAELENARAAWTWAIGKHHLKRLKSETSAFGMYYVWRGGFLEGERIFRSFASHLSDVDELADADSALLRASILNWQAFFLSELGDKTQAISLLVESQDLLGSYRLAGMDTRVLQAQNLVTITRADSSQSFDARLGNLAHARDLYKGFGQPYGVSYALNTGGRIAMVTGRLNEARKFFKESMEIYESIGNQLGRAVSLTGLGNLAFAQNKYEDAERLLRQSVDIAAEMEDLERITIASIYLGTVYLYSGKFERAKRVLEQCVASSTDLGLQPRHAASLYYLGYILLHLGEYNQAVECGKEALALAEQTIEEEIISQCILLFGATALANSAFTEARLRFEEAAKAHDLRRFARVVFGEDCGQVGLGTALLQLGRMDEAQLVFTNLLQQAVATHRQDMLLYALVGMAIHFAKQGDTERAIDLYSLASGYPFVGNSRWFTDAFGQHIGSTSTNLPAARVKEVRLKGDFENIIT